MATEAESALMGRGGTGPRAQAAGPRQEASGVSSELSYLQVADHLREQILSGALAAGHRLPAEADLAAQLGVSRLTLREGIRLLMSEKLITTRRGNAGGTFVAHPSSADVVAALGRAFRVMASTDHLSTADILEAWALIEAPAARLAAERRTQAEIDQLMELSRPPAGLGEEQAADRSFEFHRVLVQAARNALLPMLIRPLSAVVPEHFAPTRAARPRFWYDVMEELRQVASAVEAQDGDTAEAAMLAHIRRLGRGAAAT